MYDAAGKHAMSTTDRSYQSKEGVYGLVFSNETVITITVECPYLTHLLLVTALHMIKINRL